MIISQIQATLPYNIKTVWTAVTDIKNYHWRSDLSHTEVLNKYQFTEYAKNGTPTHFTTTVFKPYSCWEFTLENSSISGRWRGIFVEQGTSTLVNFTEEITSKKFYLKPILKILSAQAAKTFYKRFTNLLAKEGNQMQIIKVASNKKQYLPLLLLADEEEAMIDRYLERGTMYVLEDGGVKAECLVTDEGDGILEIKSLATLPQFQRRGYAKALVNFIEAKYKGRFKILQTGTGDSPATVPFYQKLGFVRSHIIKTFLPIITAAPSMTAAYC